MSQLINLVTMIGLLCSAFAVELRAEDSKSLSRWHRCYSLAVAANKHKAALRERTYLQLAFANHRYYSDLKGAVQQQEMPLSFEDVSFSLVCNSLAWNMMVYPMTDSDYDTAKSLLIVGTDVGGVTWFTADSIATALALTRDYDEASKWAFISSELFDIDNEPSVEVSAMMEKRSSGIEGIRSMTPWNETTVRDKLGLPALTENRIAPNARHNGRSQSSCFVLFASPRREMATIMTGDGDITTVLTHDLDALGQAECERCVQAVDDWKFTKDNQDEFLGLQQRQFKTGVHALNAMLRGTYTLAPESRPRIIQTAAADANHYFLTWGIDGILATNAAMKLEAKTKSWRGELDQAGAVAMQELADIIRKGIMAMGNGNRAAEAPSEGGVNSESKITTVAMKQTSADVGEVVIDRSKHSPAFELRILKYEDEDRRAKKGPWLFTYEQLDDKTAKTSYPTVQGSHIRAKAVWFEIVTDKGTRQCGVGPDSVNEKGQLVIEVTESRKPAILVPRSAYRADEELVHLLVNSESVGSDKAEQAEWLSQVSTMSREKRSNLKDILTNEAKQLGALDDEYGFTKPNMGRLYRIVSDDEARATAAR